jgi:hypothetical protein
MDDQTQARELAKLQREARVREFERKVVLRGLMSVRAGREWVFSLLGDCGVYHTPFATDACATAFNCGQQNIGLRLVAALVEACPDDYLRMMKEQVHDRPEPADPDADADSSDDLFGDPDSSASARLDP